MLPCVLLAPALLEVDVMAGLVPAIHVGSAVSLVDACAKRGHDGENDWLNYERTIVQPLAPGESHPSCKKAAGIAADGPSP